MQKLLATINLTALRANANTFVNLTKVPVYAVVKADAYGHGSVEVCEGITDIVNGFCVSLVEEGLTLRGAACHQEILVFTPPTNAKEVWLMGKNGLSMTVSSLTSARLVDEVSREKRLPVRVHLKCNTGMNRYGLDLPSLGKSCKRLQANSFVQVVGLYSHLYAHDIQTAEQQRKIFVMAQRVAKRYFPQVKCHLSATYGALLGQRFAFDGVRIGLGLYGYLPDDIEASELPLRKVMQVYAKCTEERRYRFGGTGYSSKEREEGENLRTLRCGYADGLSYTVKGEDALRQLLSNPCMDACVCRGDSRRLTDKWLPVMTDARQIAALQGSISYDILCRATARAERVYGYEK